MGTRFVLAFYESEFLLRLDEIMNKVAEMSGKCAKEVKVVISPYGICPLGAHIDHRETDRLRQVIEKEMLKVELSNDSALCIVEIEHFDLKHKP
ncbi:hypothetical protein Syun_031608 [Stephania yunnanensis]|uniref:Uncharacterized protein n=1 Tax=Stephania yunnanensis TaxID=152371 RepID=A0AAP0DZ15_9MAGN